LIGIAHPKFRQELEAFAKEHQLLRADRSRVFV
jgi:acyl-CoA hydrolase